VGCSREAEGSPDAAGEIRTDDQRKVLEDFYQSKVLEKLDHAAVTTSGSGTLVFWPTRSFGLARDLESENASPKNKLIRILGMGTSK
jgi:hypothetical protein